MVILLLLIFFIYTFTFFCFFFKQFIWQFTMQMFLIRHQNMYIYILNVIIISYLLFFLVFKISYVLNLLQFSVKHAATEQSRNANVCIYIFKQTFSKFVLNLKGLNDVKLAAFRKQISKRYLTEVMVLICKQILD